MTSQMCDTVMAKLKEFLRAELPTHSEQWIENLVVPFVSFRTLANIDRATGDVLDGLDFAGVLRVAEKNWSTIAYRHGFPPRVYALIKGLQLARNANAHRSSGIVDLPWEKYDCMTVDLLFRYLDEDLQDLAA